MSDDRDPLEAAEWPRFLSGMVHELRTPLASLGIIADLLERDDERSEDGDRRRYAGCVRELAREMQQLVRDVGILASLRSTESRLRPRQVPTSLSDLLARAEAEAHGQRWERGVSLSVRIASGSVTEIHTDPDLLEQAVTRLFETVIALTRSEVVVEVSATGAQLLVSARPDAWRDGDGNLEALLRPFESGVARKLKERGARSLSPLLASALAQHLGGVLVMSSGRGHRCTLSVPIEPVGATA